MPPRHGVPRFLPQHRAGSHSPFGGGSRGWPPTVRLGVGDLHCYPSSRIAYAPRTPVSPVRRAGHLPSRPLALAVAEPEGQSLASKNGASAAPEAPQPTSFSTAA
jgi:hypothetical protein